MLPNVLREIHKLLGEVIDEMAGSIPPEEQPNPETHLLDGEVALMRAGMPIHAIKEVRSRTGMTLAIAKGLVEAAGDKLGLRVPDAQGGAPVAAPGTEAACPESKSGVHKFTTDGDGWSCYYCGLAGRSPGQGGDKP